MEERGGVIREVDKERSYWVVFEMKKWVVEVFGRISGESGEVDIRDVVMEDWIIRNER